MGTRILSSAVRPEMVLVGWTASQVRPPGKNWEKLAPSLELLKYSAVAESHGDAQAGPILPSGRAWVLLGPILPFSCTGPGERRGSEQGWLLSQHLAVVAVGALMVCVCCRSLGVQASLWSQSPRLCTSPGAFRTLGKSLCDPGTAVIWGCPFGPHFFLGVEREVALHPTTVVAASAPL